MNSKNVDEPDKIIINNLHEKNAKRALLAAEKKELAMARV